MPTHLRVATILDIDTLITLARTTFWDTYHLYNTVQNMHDYMDSYYAPAVFEALLNDSKTVFYLAENEDNEAVGYAQLQYDLRDANLAPTHQKVVQLARIYVHKSAQNKGIGAVLLHGSLQAAAAKGCTALWLTVWKKNPNAIAFYQKNGFETIGITTFVLGDDAQEDWVMQKTWI